MRRFVGLTYLGPDESGSFAWLGFVEVLGRSGLLPSPADSRTFVITDGCIVRKWCFLRSSLHQFLLPQPRLITYGSYTKYT